MFKRKMTLLLAVLMVFSTVISVGATKVEFDELPTKVQWLVEEKYVEGRPNFERYGEHDMALNDTIERAEMTKLLVLSLGYTTDQIGRFDEQKSVFPDVGEGYWARGYINVAERDNIVEGHEDGEFKPAWNITFAELSAMLVRMDSRWTSRDEASAQWPNTYINTARDYGILNDIKEPTANTAVKREMAFEMFYNYLNYTEDRKGQVKITYDYNIKNMPNYDENKRDYKDEKDLETVEIFVDKDKEIGISNLPKDFKIYNRETREDMEIFYWNTKKDGSGETLTKDTKLTKDTTFYAIWEGEIKNDYVDPVRVTAKVGTEFRDLDLPLYVKIYVRDRDGYLTGRDNRIEWDSHGFDKKKEGIQFVTGTLVNPPKDFKGGDKVSAKIELIDKEKFEVTFDAKEGYFGNKTTDKIKTVEVFEKDTVGNANVPANPKRTGYTFSHWRYEGGGLFRATDKVLRDTKVEAVYIANKEEEPTPDLVTITFKPENGQKITPINIEKGKKLEVFPVLNEKPRHEFVGWYVESTDKKWNSNTKVTSDLVLKAKWNQNEFEVTKILNDENNTVQTQIIKASDSPVIIAEPNIKPEGKTFGGWKIQGDSSDEIYGQDDLITIDRDMTLIAQWEE